MNFDQLRLLHFSNVSSRMAYKVMARLSDPKRKPKLLYRDRYSNLEPYFYYIKRPGQIEHVLGVSWVYTWVRLTLTSMERLHCFEREAKYKIIRPDAFMGIKHLFSGNFSFFFIEFDIEESGNYFDKIKKYNSLYSSEEFSSAWWVPLSKRFPAIIVVTTGNKERIFERVKAENANNLEFRIYTLSEIKEECLNGRSSSKSVRTI